MCIRDRSTATQTTRLRELLKSAEGVPLLVRSCDTRADDDAPWTGAVSYTHLDVYKRQAPGRAVGRGNLHRGRCDPCGQHQLGDGIGERCV